MTAFGTDVPLDRSSPPPIALIAAPTPVMACPEVSRALCADVWCKRDDLTSPLYGGNKVRKLEYLLGDARARGCDTLVTVGALGSHHVLATALHGREHGFDVHAVLSPQPWNDHVENNLRADLAAGATLHAATGYGTAAVQVARVAATLRMRGRRPYLIGPGGSSSVGCLGYVAGAMELADQIDAGALPRPDAIYVSIGSGATAVGLALGLAARRCVSGTGAPIPIVAVRATGRAMVNRVVLGALARATARRLGSANPAVKAAAHGALACMTLDDREFGPGYGHGTPAGREATALTAGDGLVLDPTYTAKAFAALVRDARGPRRGQHLLFVHTLSGADLGPLLADAPPAPHFARRLAEREK